MVSRGSLVTQGPSVGQFSSDGAHLVCTYGGDGHRFAVERNELDLVSVVVSMNEDDGPDVTGHQVMLRQRICQNDPV